VGVDKLGPSIAMLPTADAATIAFAEVASFVGYLVREKGRAGLMLLFADLRGLGPEKANAALTSASGYDLDEWIRLWQAYLMDLTERAPSSGSSGQDAKLAGRFNDETLGSAEPIDARARARAVRLGDLLFSDGRGESAVVEHQRAFSSNTRDPALRWRFGKSLVVAGREADAAPLFESLAGVDSPHPGWLGLAGRFAAGEPNGTAASRSAEFFDMAIALNPYLEDAACEGHFTRPPPGGSAQVAGTPGGKPLPTEPSRRALCESARKIPAD
jgi:hypothetical protein